MSGHRAPTTVPPLRDELGHDTARRTSGANGPALNGAFACGGARERILEHPVRALRYLRNYPPLVNSPAEAQIAREVLEGLVGTENVQWDCAPTMGAEDFAFMLQARPGCYVFIGNGRGAEGGGLHNPRYDFNDSILALGASYWARLVERCLAAAS